VRKHALILRVGKFPKETY